MRTGTCPTCGGAADPTRACPHCGAVPGTVATALADLEREIAELAARDVSIQEQRTALSQRMQAAMHRRALLANAQDLRRRHPVAPTQVSRRRRLVVPAPGARPAPGDPGAAPTPSWTTRAAPRVAPLGGRPGRSPAPAAPPEASSGSVQNVLLVIGALLLGVSATVYAGLAIDSLGGAARAVVLAAVSALTLTLPPRLAARGLVATAETVAGVGLLLVPLVGAALWGVDGPWTGIVSGHVYAAAVFAVSAAVAAAYAAAGGLAAPRFATLLAVQPVLPLAAYPVVTGDAGWALVLAAVAALDLLLARALPTRLAGWARVHHRPRAQQPAGPAARDVARPGAPRPEAAAEEPDAVLGDPPPRPADAAARPRPAPRPDAARPVANRLLCRLGWLLVLVALGAALASAVSALVLASTVLAAGGALLAGTAAALVAVVGAHVTRPRSSLPDLAHGLLTLVLVGGAARTAAVARPDAALVAAAAILAVAAVALAFVPARRRRGPRYGAAVALVAVGGPVAAAALRAAAAALAAARPAWHADLDAYAARLAAGAPLGSGLLVAALLLVVATVLVAPAGWRREWSTVPVVLAAFAAPAALGLPWPVTPWPAAVAAVLLAAAARVAPRPRAAYAQVGGAGLAAAFAAGTALARPDLSTAVLGTLACAGIVLLATARPLRAGEHPVGAALRRAAPGDAAEWIAGATVLCVVGAVASILTAGGASAPARLAGAALAVCGGLVLAAFRQVRRRTVSVPFSVAGAVGGLGVTVAAFRLDGAGGVDIALGVLLVAAAAALPLAPAMDERIRSDRSYDGADLAAAAAIAATVAVLARTAALAAPHAPLLAAAGFVLLLACLVRTVPQRWRRGPALGLGIAGGVIALWVAAATLYSGLRVLAAPGPVWHSDLGAWPQPGPDHWQAPLAAVLLAAAAALALPTPARYDAAAGLVGLATIATPAAFGLVWWSPIVIDGLVAVAYALAAVVARDPRAGRARAVVGTAVALHAVAAGLVRPWTTAAALALVVVLGLVVAVLSRDDPRRRLLAGGGLAAALLAAPGAVACAAASARLPVPATLGLGLAASACCLLAVAAARRPVAHLLPYASAGVAGGATALALAALPTGRVALYAACAVLLGVAAELLRHRTPALPTGVYRSSRRWLLRPPMGALAAAALPGLLVVAALAPPLWAALAGPVAVLDGVWQGPPPALLALADRPDVGPADVLAMLIVTATAAAAAVGFSDGHPAQAAPVVLPGLGLTLLVAPLGLHLAWPATTLAALAVFALLMLGVALLPPPPPVAAAQPVRASRVAAFVLGLAAGGAGLAGSLATRPLTLTTLVGAVAVGAAAGFGGRTSLARILGWLFAAAAAQALALTAGLAAGWPPHWSAFGVLAAGAGLLVVAATLPRLARPQARAEAATVEWSAYVAAVLAFALAAGATGHLAALLAAWGAVLGLAATRRGRPESERRTLFWLAIGCEVVAWWLLMWVGGVAAVEAYTLPFAAVALLVGALEARQRPDLDSWLAYGPALVAAFVPSLVLVLTTTSPIRQVLLLLAAVATLILGSVRQKKAPVVVGAVVTTVAALHALVQIGPWLVLLPVGVLLLWFGAANEKRRRDIRRLRGAVRRMS
ncbi:hypothetical protein GCM10010124_04440 [Pilimelia terevasa]|uniref:Uncharacterized protein n=1 Tax=Pilimelia terevasa TaxID=53372 RepID=A0A8J3BHN0_9ACTN|nr:permease [Pilimelia terevasa]GGK14951.1 hypothetical protein GCM10010124_04440 [Pilimelia terevasa]